MGYCNCTLLSNRYLVVLRLSALVCLHRAGFAADCSSFSCGETAFHTSAVLHSSPFRHLIAP